MSPTPSGSPSCSSPWLGGKIFVPSADIHSWIAGFYLPPQKVDPSEKNRIQKCWSRPTSNWGTVISDIFGVSGRNILAQLREKGYVDEAELDECLRGRAKKKKQAVHDSLLGTLTEHELLLIRLSWKHIEELERLIDEVE